MIKPTWSRRFLFVLIAVALTLSAAAVFLGRVGATAAGFMAKGMGSGVFVSGRSPGSLRSEELAAETDLERRFAGFIEVEVDLVKRTVSATAFGLVRRCAVFRPGLGCTLVLAGSPAEYDLPRSAARDSNSPWPVGEATREPTGLDADSMRAALELGYREPPGDSPVRTRAIVVVHRGHLVAERYAPGFGPTTPLPGWSMTKSVVAALVGLRVRDGALEIDAPCGLPEWQDDERSAITLDHLLRMESGLEFDESYASPLSDAPTMLFARASAAAYAARKLLAHWPGTHWSYSSGTTNIICRLLADTFDSTPEYLAFPRTRLFGRLGMTTAVLEVDATDNFVGSSFMYASGRDWARLGLLFLADGVWQGERLLPEGWLDYCRRPTPHAPRGCYGAHFWLNAGRPGHDEDRVFPRLPSDLYYASGFRGQYLVVVPSRQLVVVRLGLTKDEARFDLQELIAAVLDALPG